MVVHCHGLCWHAAHNVTRLLLLLALLILPVRAAVPTTPERIATEVVAPLVNPAKLATLKGDRPANARLYKVLGWLEAARQGGGEVSGVIDLAQEAAGYGGSVGAKADKSAILWTYRKLEAWGCFTPDNLAKLKKGRSPLVTLGENAGSKIALDHVLPVALVPELRSRFHNLEALPEGDNLAKSAKITGREVALAHRWEREGLLSKQGLAAVLSAFKK